MWLGCRSDQSGLHAIIPESVPRCPNVAWMSQCSKRTPCYNTRKCPKVSQCVPDVAVIKADSMARPQRLSQGVPMCPGCRSDQSRLHGMMPETVSPKVSQCVLDV